MKKRLFQKSLLAITLGLILSISLMGAIGKFSTVANATVTSDSEWRLIVYGFNNNYLNLSLSDLAAMPKSTVYADLYCYGMIVTSGYWGGVNLGLLLNTAGLDRNTGTIQFRATDGYSINLPIEEAMQENVIIAYEKDDQPLPEGLRLVVPGGEWQHLDKHDHYNIPNKRASPRSSVFICLIATKPEVLNTAAAIARTRTKKSINHFPSYSTIKQTSKQPTPTNASTEFTWVDSTDGI